MKREYIIGIIILVIIVSLYFSRNKIKSVLTRGYQNNNPGNIVKDGHTWTGEKATSTDKNFKQFTSMPYGYRALFTNIHAYLNVGVNTIEKIISKWAPPSENDTKAYIAAVSKSVGLSPTTPVSFTDAPTMRKIVAAISQHENGIPANMSDIDQGYKLLSV